MATLVLTAIGADRPGLVDALSGLVSAHGGSWERSRMARLGGRFAGIVEVEVAEDRMPGLRAALAELGERDQLQVMVVGAGDEVTPEGSRVRLELVGSDQPGLLHAVTAALAALGASIEELSTDLSDAPMAGGLMFEATALVLVPAGLPIEDLRAPLEELATHLMVDIAFSE